MSSRSKKAKNLSNAKSVPFSPLYLLQTYRSFRVMVALVGLSIVLLTITYLEAPDFMDRIYVSCIVFEICVALWFTRQSLLQKKDKKEVICIRMLLYILNGLFFSFKIVEMIFNLSPVEPGTDTLLICFAFYIAVDTALTLYYGDFLRAAKKS